MKLMSMYARSERCSTKFKTQEVTCCLVTSRGRKGMQWRHNNDYMGKRT